MPIFAWFVVTPVDDDRFLYCFVVIPYARSIFLVLPRLQSHYFPLIVRIHQNCAVGVQDLCGHNRVVTYIVTILIIIICLQTKSSCFFCVILGRLSVGGANSIINEILFFYILPLVRFNIIPPLIGYTCIMFNGI